MKELSDTLQIARKDATAIFKSGLNAVAPKTAIKRCCNRQDNMLTIGERAYDLKAYKHVYLVGAGKATAAMAAAMESLLGDKLTAGAITVKYGHTAQLNTVASVEAGHPIPDQSGETGSAAILEMAKNAGPNDLCICLISGGASALMPCTVPGVTLADKQATTQILLACGATIHEMNTLRKHLSFIKGGRLALAAAPATVVSLILSDVVGDDLDVIGSGPTVPDNSTFDDCMVIVTKYDIAKRLPESVWDYLQHGVQGRVPESPKPDDPIFANTHNIIIGSNISALLAAQKEAQKRNYQTLILSSTIEGETEDVANLHAAIAKEVVQSGHPLPPPACILSGGETTVTMKGKGLGGRNQHFSLCAASTIAGQHPVVLLSGGTDGNDGPTEAAGALVDNTTADRAAAQELRIDEFIANNDAYHFFAQLDDLLITGPTNTNVMDLRIILIPEVSK